MSKKRKKYTPEQKVQIIKKHLIEPLNSETYIKNFMTGWTDKKPFGDITLLLEHRVKTIFVSA